MDDAAGLGLFKRASDVDGYPQGAGQFDGTPLQLLADGGAFDELHDEEVVPVRHAEVEEADRIGRAQQSSDVGFPLEAVAEGGVLSR